MARDRPDKGMKTRELRGLVRMLKAEGVASCTVTPAGDVSLTFRDLSAPIADAGVQAGDLELPPGVIDPRAAIQAIYDKKRGAKARAS